MLFTVGTAALIANVESNMNRRSFLSALIAAPGLAGLAAACGDPDQVPVGNTTPGTTGATTLPLGNITRPTGADEVVLRLGYEGGFVPEGYAFVNTPTLVISGDVRAFTPAAVPAVYPGPLLPQLNVRSVNEAGMQALLAVVERAGLLIEPPDYGGGENVADASNAVLTVNANGKTFRHSAYALGIDDPESGARKALANVVAVLSDLNQAAGAENLGPEQPFVAETYRFQARLADTTEVTSQQPAGTVVDWPAETGVTLATATQCGRVDAAKVGSLFSDAKQNTYFKEDDAVYQLAVAGVLPGDPTC
jgi:hypothetical protein